MNKILLVIQREYSTRVKKPSFWILTLVVPILLAALYAIPIMLATKPMEHANVLVVDDSGLFQGQFRSGRDITYFDAGSLDYAKRQLASVDTLDAIVFIPARETSIPLDAFLYYRTDAPSMTVQSNVNNQLQEILRNTILLDVHGITPDDYAMLTGTRIHLRTQDIETGRDGFLQIKLVIGALLAILVFMAVFMFGSQVMRGVMEEKTSRIVEVIVCSVKPFQLMMGKVVGIGLVGLTQFALWVLLSGVAMAGVRISNADLFEQASARHNVTQVATKGTEATAQYQAARYEAEQYEAGVGVDKEEVGRPDECLHLIEDVAGYFEVCIRLVCNAIYGEARGITAAACYDRRPVRRPQHLAVTHPLHLASRHALPHPLWGTRLADSRLHAPAAGYFPPMHLGGRQNLPRLYPTLWAESHLARRFPLRKN